MARDGRWVNQLWDALYRIQPSWLGGCRGVALQGRVKAAGFHSVTRDFVSQMTFPSEIIFGVR